MLKKKANEEDGEEELHSARTFVIDCGWCVDGSVGFVRPNLPSSFVQVIDVAVVASKHDRFRCTNCRRGPNPFLRFERPSMYDVVAIAPGEHKVPKFQKLESRK